MNESQQSKREVLGLGSAIMDLLYHVPEEFMRNVDGLKGGTQMMSADEMDALIAKIPSEGKIVQGDIGHGAEAGNAGYNTYMVYDKWGHWND